MIPTAVQGLAAMPHCGAPFGLPHRQRAVPR